MRVANANYETQNSVAHLVFHFSFVLLLVILFPLARYGHWLWSFQLLGIIIKCLCQ